MTRRNSSDDGEEVLEALDVDFRYIAGPRYVGPELTVRPDGQVEDHFGVPRFRVQFGKGEKSGAYREVINFPLVEATTLDEIKSYSK